MEILKKYLYSLKLTNKKLTNLFSKISYEIKHLWESLYF